MDIVAQMNQSDRADLFNETAALMGLHPVIVEKDFRVCWILKQLWTIEKFFGMLIFIRYAENTTDFDDDKLKLIGWAGKAAAPPLALPGQARLLEAPRQDAGWVFLDFKSPADGGKVSAETDPKVHGRMWPRRYIPR